MKFAGDVNMDVSEDSKTVTITIKSEEKMGLHVLIRVLANFIKHQIDKNGIAYKDVSVGESDVRIELPG